MDVVGASGVIPYLMGMMMEKVTKVWNPHTLFLRCRIVDYIFGQVWANKTQPMPVQTLGRLYI
jgi:hypothetical protein